MIKIENTEIAGWEAAIRGMRNPMNSWNRSDSGWSTNSPEKDDILIDSDFEGYVNLIIGPNDRALMMSLAKAGPVHGKYRRMIVVYTDILAPLYWWKEFDTYKVGTVGNSCSTMHKIHSKEFTFDDFSHEHIIGKGIIPDHTYDNPYDILYGTINCLNIMREKYLETKDKTYWWQMIQLLPSSYNQRRTVMLNYEVLSNIYIYRRDHKLDEWREFCHWIEGLPCSEIITCNAEKDL